MFFAMIPVHDLIAVVEVITYQIPDPDCPICHDFGITGLPETTPLSFCPNLLPKYFGATQVADIGIMAGSPLFDPFASLGVQNRMLDHIKQATDFQFFPLFPPELDHDPIHREPHPAFLTYFSGDNLFPIWRSVGLFLFSLF